MGMQSEQIKNIKFSKVPDVRVRVIAEEDTEETKKQKKRFPFELLNAIEVGITTNFRQFSFTIYKKYTWNGADIPRFFWRIIGSRTDNDFLMASMLHDFLLEYKFYIIREILNDKITPREYRRLTSLVFRYMLKRQGTNVIKANIMSYCVDVYQSACKRKEWGKL